MKKLLIILLLLCFTTPVYADVILPQFMAWNFSALILFIFIALIEAFIIKKSLHLSSIDKIMKTIITANVISSVAGLFFGYIPTEIRTSTSSDVLRGFIWNFEYGVEPNMSFLNVSLCLILSWVIEYFYLRRFLKDNHAKHPKTLVFVANFFSYAWLVLIYICITWLSLCPSGGIRGDVRCESCNTEEVIEIETWKCNKCPNRTMIHFKNRNYCILKLDCPVGTKLSICGEYMSKREACCKKDYSLWHFVNQNNLSVIKKTQ